MNLKKHANDYIGYEGSVKITFKLGDKQRVLKLTNNGTQALFKGLVEHAIYGNNVNVQNSENNYVTSWQYVASLKLVNALDVSDSVALSQPLNITPTAVQIGNSYDESYTLRIISSIVSGYLNDAGMNQNIDNIYLILLSNNGIILAYIKFPLEVLMAIREGVQAIIQWDLTFSNKVAK